MLQDELAASFNAIARADSPQELLQALLAEQFLGPLADLPIDAKEQLRLSCTSPSLATLRGCAGFLANLLQVMQRHDDPEDRWAVAILRADLCAYELLLGEFDQFNRGVAEAFQTAAASGDSAVVLAVLAMAWP